MSATLTTAEGMLVAIIPFWVRGTLVIWGRSRTLGWGWGLYQRWRITKGAACRCG
ncbi:unnamed protein product [Prunus armeniaca]